MVLCWEGAFEKLQNKGNSINLKKKWVNKVKKKKERKEIRWWTSVYSTISAKSKHTNLLATQIFLV